MQQNDQDIDKLLEEFEFSAITDGLGFHHSVSETTKVEKSLSQKANELDLSLKKHVENLKNRSEGGHLNRGELSPFYTEESTLIEKPEAISDLLEVEPVDSIELAGSYSRFVAWGLDILFVSFLTAITTASSFFISGIPLDSLYLLSEVGLSLSLSMFLLFFVLYFSVMDTSEHSTFGKRILGIKVVRNLKPMNLTTSLKRTLFCLSSLFMGGLPLLLKTQDMFFNTQVIKK